MAERIDVGHVIVQSVGKGDMTTFVDTLNEELQKKGITVTNREDLDAAEREIRFRLEHNVGPYTELGKKLWPVYVIARNKALEVEEERERKEFGPKSLNAAPLAGPPPNGGPGPGPGGPGAGQGGKRRRRKSRKSKKSRKTRRRTRRGGSSCSAM